MRFYDYPIWQADFFCWLFIFLSLAGYFSIGLLLAFFVDTIRKLRDIYKMSKHIEKLSKDIKIRRTW